jgi:hypothetical protein
MRQRIKMLFGVLALLLASAFSFYAGRQTAPSLVVKLDNPRVTITESTTPTGARRESYVRTTDQIIVFLDEAQYEAVDDGGKPTMRNRKAGDFVWHAKGEVAPTLINKGKAYRNLIIALK